VAKAKASVAHGFTENLSNVKTALENPKDHHASDPGFYY
jgi:hypothetical protein